MSGAAPVRLKTRIDSLWDAYTAAAAKAQATGDINDGIAAGRAWRAWLAEFEGKAL